MTSAFDLRTRVGCLRLVAMAEAVSWLGLLVGMYFKYLGTPRTEIGVKVFGMAHGLIFIAFVVTVGLIGTFQVFDQIWVMSEGGPAKTTTTLAYLIYVEGFQQGRGLGYASAIAMVLLFVILVLYLVQRQFTEERPERTIASRIRLLAAPFALINYAVLGYVLGRGEGTLALLLQLVLNGINIVLSIVLGLHLGWGVAGVAWGTFGGELAIVDVENLPTGCHDRDDDREEQEGSHDAHHRCCRDDMLHISER